MSKRFQNNVAIVTGSSNGIGRETAVLFAEEGAKITITGRNEQTLEETLQLLLKAGAAESDILKIQGDIIEEETQKKLVEETVSKFGKIDILVNNAGSIGPNANRGELCMENYDYVLNLNARSVLTLTELAIPHLKDSHGDVVIISSIAGLPLAAPNAPAYAMAKAALDQMMRSLAIKYAPDGIRINGINPGVLKTAFLSRYGLPEQVAGTMYEKIGADHRMIPRGSYGTPRDIAEAIAFLSDRKVSSFILGHNLVVDGGSAIQNPIMNADFKEYI